MSIICPKASLLLGSSSLLWRRHCMTPRPMETCREADKSARKSSLPLCRGFTTTLGPGHQVAPWSTRWRPLFGLSRVEIHGATRLGRQEKPQRTRGVFPLKLGEPRTSSKRTWRTSRIQVSATILSLEPSSLFQGAWGVKTILEAACGAMQKQGGGMKSQI